MRSNKSYQNLIRKFQMLAGIVICLTAFAVLCTAQTRSYCEIPRMLNHIDFTLFDPVTNDPVGGVYFNILSDGSTQFYAGVYRNEGYPTNTLFTLYINGVRITDLENWEYLSDSQIARVGDLIEIYKNGSPYFSGHLTREKWDSEMIDAVPYVVQSQTVELCSYVFGQVWLPSSPYPNEYHLELSFPSRQPPTRITINEPPTDPDSPGEVITELEFITYPPHPKFDFFQTRATTPGVYMTLTDRQFRYLRQGLLSYTVYAPGLPNGFINRHLNTYAANRSSDFEGDGQTDLAVFRPSERNWHMLLSSNNQYNVVNFGFSNDKLVAGDYDADGKTDIAVYQPNNPNFENQGVWQILKSSDNSVITERWGLPDDIPLTMNYDGNNAADIVAFRPSSGNWYIKRMGDIIKPFSELPGNDPQGYRIIQWGTAGDKPLTADFDGDGIDELAVFRPSEGNWYIYNRVANNYQIIHWGIGEDHPLPKDFDGDGRADLAVFRPSNGTWYILNSLDNSVLVRQFGLNGDIPVPADFDKDTVADIAVFRPSNGVWYIWRSADNTISFAQFGSNGDIPVMAQ